jgi:hypothetical protein
VQLGVDSPAVDRDISEDRRADIVVLPEVVVNHLEVPHTTAGSCIERDETV